MINDKAASSATVRSDEILQLISIRVGSEVYGIDILRVLEIIRVPEITQVSQAPSSVDGIINLRGRMIPILNTRRRFTLKNKENDSDTRIVVIENDGEMIGLLVDEVNEVLRVSSQVVEPTPGLAADADYINGMARLDEQVLNIIDLPALLGEVIGFSAEKTGRPTL